MEATIVGRRSCAARALRQALLVMLVDVVLATEAAAPAAQAAHWPPRTRRRRQLLDAPPEESGAAVTTTGCTGASAGLAADQCAAWGQFFDGAVGNTQYSQHKFIVVHNDQPVTTITESHRECNEIQCQPRVISLLLLTVLHFAQTRAKGVGGGGRAIAKLMLVMGLLLEEVAGGTGNGASAGLAPDQLAAWGQFWDGAGGPNWINLGQGCTKLDPCGSGCCRAGPGDCTVQCSGSSITKM
jgi:hypothetical protein